jgi:amidase
MTDPTFLPAWRLAELIRGGAMSCLELLDHYIARIERLDGKTNAVVVRDFERAREHARKLDGQRKDGRATPLFGVPMTVKESFNLAGLPTTWGHEAQRNSAAHEDALAVQRLTAAGAVVFGKTNVPVDLADWQSFNPVYGATSNPWNLAHTPGGSSGGGAAAMAAGLAALEIGSDIGGSIRVPAHYCGVFGHKPSWGLCSSRGQSLVPIAGDDRHRGDRPVCPLGDGPVAGTGRDHRLRSAAGCRQRDTAATARRAAVGTPDRRLVERTWPGNRYRDHGAYRRAGRVPGTGRRAGQPHRAA